MVPRYFWFFFWCYPHGKYYQIYVCILSTVPLHMNFRDFREAGHTSPSLPSEIPVGGKVKLIS